MQTKLYWACDYLFILELKLNYVGKLSEEIKSVFTQLTIQYSRLCRQNQLTNVYVTSVIRCTACA